MSNFRALVKVNIRELFAGSGGKKRSSAGKQILMALVMIFAFGVLVFQQYIMSLVMGQTLMAAGADLSPILTLACVLPSMLILVMGIYQMPTYLFAFKDYDLLMSLPIRQSDILGSKLAALYLWNAVMALLFSGPGAVVYGQLTGAGALYYLEMVVLALFIPFIPMVVGAILAFLLGKISSKTGMKNLVMIVGTVLLLGVIMVASYGTASLADAGASQVASTLAQTAVINPAAILYMNGMAGSLLDFALFILASLGVFVLFVLIFSKGFRSINASMRQTGRRRAYKEKSIKASTAFGALYKKEIKGFFGSYIYLLNCGIGVIFLTIACCVLAFSGDSEFMQQLMMMGGGNLLAVLGIVFGFCIAMTNTCAPSISIEGDRIWILKSLPILPKAIFQSKLLLNLTLTIPAVILNVALVAVGMNLGLEQIFILLAYGIALSFFVGTLGLFVNLCFPKLDYKNPVIAVKQSASVLICILVGMVVGFVPFVVGMSAGVDAAMLMLILTGLFAAASALFWSFIVTKGQKIFRALEV